jgi:hypothetical protein
MSVRSILQSAAANSSPIYVEDVFSTYLYTGNGTTQTISNGIDLAGKGGLVWVKQRSGIQDHTIFDTARGVNNYIRSNSTGAQNPGGTYTDLLTAFNATGFSLGADALTAGFVNNSGTFASWTFRKQPKFFDVITYTGSGLNRVVSHNLGSTPGCIMVKRTDTTGDWQVYHNGLTSAAYSIQLNLTNAQASATTVWNSTAPTSTLFSIGTDASVNAAGGTYVAYLFAHNAGGFGTYGVDNVISCGSFTGSNIVNLGYEPQYLLVKNASTAGNWYVMDTMRGFDSTGYAFVDPNLAQAEFTTGTGITINNVGFNQTVGGTDTYIYITIRRPMKIPSIGTSVFSTVLFTGDSVVNRIISSLGFPADFAFFRTRNNVSNASFIASTRIIGGAHYLLLNTSTSDTSSTAYGVQKFGQDSVTLGSVITYEQNQLSFTYFLYSFKRAPGFFDTVYYTGTGAVLTLNHNLSVTPELIITKSRSTTGSWDVCPTQLGLNYSLLLNSSSPVATLTPAGYSEVTNSFFTLSNSGVAAINNNAVTYISYLFASCPGVSKVGSYNGNGTSQTINCGFSTGARFILIKSIINTGDWYIWDSARGIVAANDPHVSLNTAVAEVTTDDSIDPDNSGFIVNQVAATNINVLNASYLFLAIA